MFYTMSEYLMFSFLYNQIAIEGDLAEQIYYKKLLATAIATSVKNQQSLITQPEAVFNSMPLPYQTFSSLSMEKYKIQGYFRDLERLIGQMRDNAQIAKRLQRELVICAEHKIQIICLEDADYPEKLRATEAPSPVLYVKGDMPSFQDLEQSVAVIGMHMPDGEHAPLVAMEAAIALQEKKWWNISGLAKGCDTLGHIASLKIEGSTGAIVPFGLASLVDPLENTLLAEAIIDAGGFLMSERFPSMEATRLFSALRNRIQSALTTALFVIESDYASSTMITVDESLKLKKTIFVYDPKGDSLPKKTMLEGNRMLLSLKKQEKNDSFLFDSYEDTHIVGVSTMPVFHDWLDYMNGDKETLPC